MQHESQNSIHVSHSGQRAFQKIKKKQNRSVSTYGWIADSQKLS